MKTPQNAYEATVLALSLALVPCPMCHGNGYVYDEDGPADCRHCNSQGEVTPDRATYEEISNGY